MAKSKANPPSEKAGSGLNGPGAALSPKQETAAVALAGGATLERAAKTSGAGLTTIKTWLAECPAFRARIAEARAELSSRVMGRIAGGMVTAIDTLERLCNSESEPTQLKAAEALLTHGTALAEVAQLKARVDEIERSRR